MIDILELLSSEFQLHHLDHESCHRKIKETNGTY